jgi:hypothetical protein
LPGPLQRLHAARNHNAAPVKFSDWLAAALQRSPTVFKTEGLHESLSKQVTLNFFGVADALGEAFHEIADWPVRRSVAVEPNDNCLAARIGIFSRQMAIDRGVHAIIQAILDSPKLWFYFVRVPRSFFDKHQNERAV